MGDSFVTRLLLVTVIAGGFAGCSGEKQATVETIRAINRADRAIWVGGIQGFEDEPPMGILIPKASKSATQPHQPLPNKITITWWEGDGDHKLSEVRTSEVELQILDPKAKSHTVDLIFGKDEKWTYTMSQPGMSLD